MATEAMTPSTPATGGSKKIFVGNLPSHVENEKFFETAGKVVEVLFATSNKDGSFMGYCYAEFASSEEAQKALKFNGKTLLGHEIRLDVAPDRGMGRADTQQSSYTGGFAWPPFSSR